MKVFIIIFAKELNMLQVYGRIKKNNKNIFFISVLVKAPRKVTKNNRETERR